MLSGHDYTGLPAQMNKTRIHLLLGANTLVIYGLILFLLPEGNMQQWVVIGIAMAVMMIAPSLTINNALTSLETRAISAERELESVSEELASIKEKFFSRTLMPLASASSLTRPRVIPPRQ